MVLDKKFPLRLHCFIARATIDDKITITIAFFGILGPT